MLPHLNAGMAEWRKKAMLAIMMVNDIKDSETKSNFVSKIKTLITLIEAEEQQYGPEYNHFRRIIAAYPLFVSFYQENS